MDASPQCLSCSSCSLISIGSFILSTTIAFIIFILTSMIALAVWKMSFQRHCSPGQAQISDVETLGEEEPTNELDQTSEEDEKIDQPTLNYSERFHALAREFRLLSDLHHEHLEYLGYGVLDHLRICISRDQNMYDLKEWSDPRNVDWDEWHSPRNKDNGLLLPKKKMILYMNEGLIVQLVLQHARGKDGERFLKLYHQYLKTIPETRGSYSRPVWATYTLAMEVLATPQMEHRARTWKTALHASIAEHIHNESKEKGSLFETCPQCPACEPLMQKFAKIKHHLTDKDLDSVNAASRALREWGILKENAWKDRSH